MASAVTDLEAGLQAMLNLKPPGVSGSRITSLTNLCVTNIQSESVLIQKIFTHFKKAPGSHKLGVLYVVDSVTRKWLEQAKAQGQTVNGSAQDGTFAAGVHRVTELMPVLMNDIVQTAPTEQKEKIRKLLDIWEKGQTFPQDKIESFRQKLSASPPPTESTTPPGTPPKEPLASVPQRPGSGAANGNSNVNPSSGSSILEALANIARQNTSAPPAAASHLAPAPAPVAYSLPTPSYPQPTSGPPAAPVPQQPQYSAASGQQQQPAGILNQLPFSFPGMPAPAAQPATAPAPGHFGEAPAPFAAGMPSANNSGQPFVDPNTQQQIMLIKLLADQGVPFDKIPALIQSMQGANIGAGAQAAASATQQYPNPAQQSWGAPNQTGGDDRRDNGYGGGQPRSPSRYHGRSRSRSPDRGWGSSRDQARGGVRGSPRGGRYDDRDNGDSRRGGGSDYRQRSPQGRRGGRSPSPPTGSQQKWVEYDNSLPDGHIRVYSRTLFVGGVTCPEAEVRRIFGRFGTVQTCIVNKDKRHAFVKMVTRKDAVKAKEGTEDVRTLELPLRTRWGVGFGPRDCSDYSTGISVIPIHKLTEADRKWMLTAPFGGSGGRPIESGMCVEEPDIEIGAGVSSKAISRRMQTDKGGSHGPRSTRQFDDGPNGDAGGGGGGGRGGRRGGGRDDYRRGGGNDYDGANNAAGGGGAAPSFPFGIGTLPNGMPNFPAGFAFPDPNEARR